MVWSPCGSNDLNIDPLQEIFAIDMLRALNMFCDPYNYMETRL